MTVRWHRNLFVRLGVAALILGLSAGTVSALARDASYEPRPAYGGFPSDVNGDGLISDTGSERIPELVASDSDHHVGGYVRLEDLEYNSDPANPQDAVASNADVRVIPVYAQDGVTIVDTLTIVASHTETSTDSGG